ncbi:fimbria/pilus outer membrane usher protein [Stenotrophomonas maltophilia]|uniref:fimbria/pilus outer membrane usher protein n=1 Tax=Stenotrophomonas maltophilia TaxID=40324 RepID=UPI001F5BA18B|nr:fimbria/pilus outer membrane usher protein [Stenotrophomonas maltophilia]
MRASLIAACLCAPAAHAAPAGEVEFSEGFAFGLGVTDIARFNNGNPIEAGTYNVDVTVNGEPFARRDVAFVSTGVADAARLCLPISLLGEMGLKDAVLAAAQQSATGECLELESVLDGARVSYDDSALALHITIPQAYVQRAARGYVAPELRDAGVTAGFIDYSTNSHRSDGRTSHYLGLNAGVNLGPWRLRHRSSVAHSSERGTQASVISSYLQRDLPRWNSQLLLGQSNTGGELFDSVAFTGLRVATDDRMLPDSLRGYAPVVRGIAQSNAKVTIRQNGAIIYETTVAPGAFVVDDLYPTNGGGDLQVTVTESDGREETSTVAFSAVPQALREGSQRMSFTAGTLRDTGRTVEPLRFVEGTYVRGMSNRVTALGGVQFAEGYQSALIGAALNTPFGAIGIDATHAQARLGTGQTSRGQSFRVNYQRSIAQTGTNFGLAAYRYSTEGYFTLNDAASLVHQDAAAISPMRARSRFQVNFSQRIGEHSQISLSGGHSAYWSSNGGHSDLQLGFNSYYRSASYHLSATRYRTAAGHADTRYGLTVNVPLGRAARAPRLNTSVIQSAQGQQRQLGVSGTLGEDHALSYSVSGQQGAGTQGYNAHARYQGSYFDLNAGYSRAAGYQSMNLGASGSVVVHRGGINLGPALGESFALVEARGATGAQVGTSRKVSIARNGYAIVPYTSPYRWNTIDLDTSGAALDVDVDGSSRKVAPTAGSIVKLSFDSRNEPLLFVDAVDSAGMPLPFAAPISDEQGRVIGSVGQGGIIQLRLSEAGQALRVGLEDGAQCELNHPAPAATDAERAPMVRAICEPLGQQVQSASQPPGLSNAASLSH